MPDDEEILTDDQEVTEEEVTEEVVKETSEVTSEEEDNQEVVDMKQILSTIEGQNRQIDSLRKIAQDAVTENNRLRQEQLDRDKRRDAEEEEEEDVPLTGADILNDPEKLRTKMRKDNKKDIEAAFEKIAGPLNELREFKTSFATQGNIEMIKGRLKTDSKISEYYEDIEPSLDAAIAQMTKQGIPVTEDNIRGIVAGAVGGVALGMIPRKLKPKTKVKVVRNDDEEDDEEVPAHIPSRGPKTIDRTKGETKVPPVSELEKRLMKENGWNPSNAEHVKEYKGFQTMDSRKVANSDLGKKKPLTKKK